MGIGALKSAIKILEVRIHERELANHADRDQIRILAETVQRIESKKQEASKQPQESRGATAKGNHTT